MKLNNLFALFSILLLTSCATDAPSDDKSGSQINKYEDINVAEFKAKFATTEPFQLLDVRTPEECAEGVIENALAMDFYDDSFDADLNTLDPNVPVLVYCRSGGRSGKAMDMMQSKGFVEVYNLDGGITAWKEAGEDIVK
ncbi:MAG: rhodanese-related sulfurtransferase [Flavobacteriales bacterium]|jgi:phage shock protein E